MSTPITPMPLSAPAFFADAKPCFRGQSLNRETEVLVPDEELPLPRSIDGGV